MLSFPNIDPIAFSLGPIAVRWYGLAYVAAFFTGLAVLKWAVKRHPGPIKTKDVDDIFLWLMIGVVIGGRLGYVVFYNFDYFLANPGDILKTWQGGMSFHGGLLGVLATVWLFAKRRGFHFFDITDRLAVAIPLGLLFGRLANFINGELYGRPTDMPWGMVFPHAGDVARHPSQLYEAGLEGLLLFVVLFMVARKRVRRFELSGLFLLGYGAARFVVEFTRQPDNLAHLQTGLFQYITMGQLLSLPMMAFGLWLLLLSRKQAGTAQNEAGDDAKANHPPAA